VASCRVSPIETTRRVDSMDHSSSPNSTDHSSRPKVSTSPLPSPLRAVSASTEVYQKASRVSVLITFPAVIFTQLGMLFNCFQNRFSDVLPGLYFHELAARGSFDLTLLTYSTHSPGASTKWFPKVSGAKCVGKSNAMAECSRHQR
jgi:hypothetical protein